ncbi:TctA family transporter [Micromonospora rhizosphaerae]|uniref:TctA family transporter n=1 Tax=Micromonospora rhizosphaerae TaxID=568872 RepID=A0A1C6SAI2_9ACTN|nr:tripartite tricarboxylate transporter permease [Micromonospora rhizosphaerae]SCL26473.1 TctA family transporter [Micromonospora rhizosphaerae]
MFDAALSALGALLDPSLFLLLACGVLAGLVMGIIPGLGGTGAVAVLLPFAFILEPQQALALIIGAVAVVHTSDTISAVLIGVPGSASSTVTLMDGHAMAKQGQAARALSIAFLSSMAGGLLGAIGLTLSIPIARPLVLAFGSPELFMLTILGISLTATLSRGNMMKGLLAGALGVLLGQVGGAPAAADYRFTFDSLFLQEGLDLVAVALGIFGLAEVVHLVARRGAVSEVSGIGGGWRVGIRDFFTHWTHVIRGALIGIWAGVLPGVGATAGTWMAYGQAVASSKDKRKFGKGDPRGIIGPESANNSVEAGDLIPTLLFGIPGGAPAALLMGALLLYGVEPGPRLITDHLDLVYTIVWSFALASVLGAALCFGVSVPLARLSSVPFPILGAGLVVIMFVSAYQEPQQFAVLQVMLLLALLGWLMKVGGFPRAPFLIGFVLSIPMERYYFLTDRLYTTGEWLSRPGVLIMMAVLVLPLLLALRRKLARPKVEAPEAGAEDGQHLDDEDEGPQAGALDKSLLPVGLAAVFLALFAGALVLSAGFSERAALMPRIIAVVGMLLAAGVVATELRTRRRTGQRAPADWRGQVANVAVAFGWLVVFLVFVYVAGTMIAAALFIPLFLWRVGRWQPLKIVIYTLGVLAALWVLHQYAEISLPVGLYTPEVLK